MAPSNVIDIPRPAGSPDLLGVDRAIGALVRFIGAARMPTTLAIQGEWGSGKTSLMNQVRHALCESEEGEHTGKPFHGIWINTWQYALMRSPEDVLLNVIGGITGEILRIIQRRHQSRLENTLDSVKGMLRRLARVGAKTAAAQVGVTGAVVDEFIAASRTRSEVEEFRERLAAAVRDCLEADRDAGASARGFLFFIDDLDRLDPPVAVRILELLKNLFEVENCMFVLAIDYGVVVKGLAPKFGELTERNEREFRSFFDKIIQLPFTMPVQTYQITGYLSDALLEIGYYTAEELAGPWGDASLAEVLTRMVQLSAGANPRSVKRLINTLSLINIMGQVDGRASLGAHDRLLSFGTVCVQIAYPGVYAMLLTEPDFTSWDAHLARSLRLPELAPDEEESLSALDDFSEEWQRVLYRAGRNDAWLAERVFSASRLLTLLSSCVSSDEALESAMERVLGFAAVTTVTSRELPQRASRSHPVRVTAEAFSRALEENASLPDEAREMFRVLHDSCLRLFGDLVRAEYTEGGFYLYVAHPAKRRASLLQAWPADKRLVTKPTTPAGTRMVSLPLSGEDRESRWRAFFEELLAGYNKLAARKHRLGTEALERVRG